MPNRRALKLILIVLIVCGIRSFIGNNQVFETYLDYTACGISKTPDRPRPMIDSGFF